MSACRLVSSEALTVETSSAVADVVDFLDIEKEVKLNHTITAGSSFKIIYALSSRYFHFVRLALRE